MGVPKFFRWISERYPCLSVSVENNQIPTYDCLYLDMNGIIHICSHPDDSNVHFRITESDIFSNIFNYIEFLFKTVKPKDVFFLAVDGVAPRAKMNQQRARRFKSAKEAINRESAAIRSGIKLPDEKRFDSNAITPGTEFMDRLQKALKVFLNEKIKSDSLWQGVDVILSGHETPGEGEHKIQDFIRYRRSLPNYNPNTRHCLYGLDADLMLLGLASHEPYFSLLREEVTTKRKTKRAYIAEETKFFLLHLSLLREYIDYEFSALRNVLENEYSLERIIDDWVIMSFLVGNDFVPHLPNLHIHTSALPFLWETYIKTRPHMKGYINDCGKLDLDNLLHYIDALSIFDLNIFLERYEDMQWMMGKTGEMLGNELQNLDKNQNSREQKKSNIMDATVDDLDASLANLFIDSNATINDHVTDNSNDVEELFSMISEAQFSKDRVFKNCVNEEETDKESDETLESGLMVPMGNLANHMDLIDFGMKDNENEKNSDGGNDNNFPNAIMPEGDETIWQLQYRCYKRDYYYSKMGLTSSDEVLMEQANEYITALQWISYYYFCGVPSWSWFYPQHYAPFISDLCNLNSEIRQNGVQFDIGHPFLPFEQLMAVLPGDSCELLPKCFQHLMTDQSSPIIDFYPKSFQSDLNGKKKEWEAVILIPFIDEQRLLKAMKSDKFSLTPYEIQRNVHSSHIKFRLSNSILTIDEIDLDTFRILMSKIVTGLCPNVHLDVLCQGFPTFHHINHTFVLEKVGVKIFEFSANSSSILLKISPPEDVLKIETIAREFVGKVAYVNWPAFIEVKVTAILSETHRVTVNMKTKELLSEPLNERDILKMKEFKQTTPRNLFKRSAISIDENNFFILEVFHSDGKTYQIADTHKAGTTIRLEHNWNTTKSLWYLHQLAILKESINVFESNSSKICTKLHQLFPKNGVVFCLDSTHYGNTGHVMSINNAKVSIKLQLDILVEPVFPAIDLSIDDEGYMNAAMAAQHIDLNPLLFSRITGTIYISLFPPSPSANHRNKKGDRNKTQCAIGLDLKNNKSNLQIPGWVIKTTCENQTSKWLYSMKVVRVLLEYKERFPEIFAFIHREKFESLSMEDIYDKENVTKRSSELTEFINGLPYRNLERISNQNQIVSESKIALLEKCVDHAELDGAAEQKDSVEVELAFQDIYRPHDSVNGVKPDRTTKFELLDRVTCSTSSYTVPIGLRGVVIGIEPRPNDDVRLEVLFDKEFKSAISIRGSQARCYRMPAHTLISISHGFRQRMGKPSTPVTKKSRSSNTNHHKTLKSVDQVDNVPKAPVIRTPSSSEIILTNVMSSKKSGNSPIYLPMPSKEFLAENVPTNEVGSHRKQKNFIAHCNNLFKEEITKMQDVGGDYRAVYTVDNCIPVYLDLFSFCQQCSIFNVEVGERHTSSGFYISFTSAWICFPEVREPNAEIGRANLFNRLYNFVFSPHLNGYHHYEHLYMPDQFQDNPFMQLYPQKQFHAVPTNQNSRRNNVPMSPKAPAAPIDKCRNQMNQPKNEQKKKATKPFISAPKPKGNLFPK